MNVALAACAPSDGRDDWHSIDWAKCHSEVKRLQARIVKAVQEGRWGKVKALQWLLTHSWYGKALAVKRVTENRGKKTPGVDGVTWSTPSEKADGATSLTRRGYQPKPLRRVNIPKANGKQRPLGIPTMTDRAMQALYLLALDPVAETTADLDSYGFRQGRSCADAIERCFVSLASGNAAEWVLEGDIKGCFDNISHDWMLAHLPVDKAVLRKWLKAGYVEGGKLFPTDAGTPQGGIISPTLANLVLDGMEEMLQKLGKVTFNKKGVCGNPWKLNFCRYADDFIVTSNSREVLETRVKPAIESFLKERGLELSQEKTRITHISEGFDFLGQTVRKFDGTLLTRPSKKSVRQIFAKVREIVTGNKASTQAGLIRLLNPVIRGWAMYHRHAVSSDAFARVKDYVWGLLWRWAKRRHTNKSRNWIMRRYFMTIEGRSWVFACRDGNQKLVRLFEAPDLKIQRHVKVQGKANPYDPEWEPYFEERMKFKMLASTVGRRKLLSIWLAQEGKCPMCNQPVTKESGWHVHHLKWRVHGGGDEKSNLALLHQNCHAQVHSLGLHSLPVPLTRRLRKA